MPELVTVPTFQFEQGELFDEEGSEYPINVRYYDGGTIELEQRGDNVLISKKYFEALVKEIRRHHPEAEKALKQR